MLSEPMEYARMEVSFTPVMHRLNQAVRHRAVYSEKSMAPVPEALIKYSNPPTKLLEKAEPSLNRLKEVADVKRGRHNLLSSLCHAYFFVPISNANSCRLQSLQRHCPASNSAARNFKNNLAPASTSHLFSPPALIPTNTKSPKTTPSRNSSRWSLMPRTLMLSKMRPSR